MSSVRSHIAIMRLLPIVGHRVQYRRGLVENVDRPSKLHGKVWHHHGTSAIQGLHGLPGHVSSRIRYSSDSTSELSFLGRIMSHPG